MLSCSALSMMIEVKVIPGQEYEGHVNLAERAHERARKMQAYLEMGDEHRAEAQEELKSKWRQKLQLAHEAVLETKALYDKADADAREYKVRAQELEANHRETEDDRDNMESEIKSLMVNHLF